MGAMYGRPSILRFDEAGVYGSPCIPLPFIFWLHFHTLLSSLLLDSALYGNICSQEQLQLQAVVDTVVLEERRCERQYQPDAAEFQGDQAARRSQG